MTRERAIELLALLQAAVASGRISAESFVGLERWAERLATLGYPATISETPAQGVLPLAGVSASPAPEGARVARRDLDDAAERIFAYWTRATGKTGALFTTDRKSKVVARLREGYTEADIRAAIDGILQNDWNTGGNERGKQYVDLTLICRSGSKLEGYIEDAPEKPRGRAEGLTVQESETEHEITKVRAAMRRAQTTVNPGEYERLNERLRQLLRARGG